MSVYRLPRQLTSFIGRQEELRDIEALLDSCRLLTLAGAGGIGKTRLAIEVAARTAGQYKHGVWFAPFQGVSSPELIVPTLASTLSFPFYEGSNAKQQLLGYLSEKELLLVIDNFEHLVAGAEFLVELLTTTAHLKLLVTSREALNLRDEWLYQVEGMRFPHSGKDAHEEYSAVTLFAERARQIRPYFLLDSERSYVIRICQLVEGMPLAIEMAAAWLKTMTCEEIARQIQGSFDFLMTPLRDVPDRHRSVRAVFDYSWQSLSEVEQDVFMKLSVFQGGCTLQAAEAVTGASLLLISTLVDKSLVRMTPDGRFEIHELLRQYGAEQLELSGQTGVGRDAHCHYYLSALAQRESDIKGYRQLEALGAIDADFSNVQAAWKWAVHQKKDDLLNRALESLYWFCAFRARFQEGEALLRLDTSSLSESTGGRILTRLTSFLAMTHFEPLQAPIHHCLKIAQNNHDQQEIAFCLATLAEIALLEGNYSETLGYYQKALDIHLGDPFFTAYLLRRIGLCRISYGDLEGSRAALQESLDLARGVGDGFGVGTCLYNLGSIAGFSGDRAESERYYHEALLIRHDIGDKSGVSINLGGLACATFLKGDFAAAARLAEESLEIALDIHHAESRAFACTMLGLVACAEETYERAQDFLERGRYPPRNPLRKFFAELGFAMINYHQANFIRAKESVQSALTYPSGWGTVFTIMVMPLAGLIMAEMGETRRGVELIAYALHDSKSLAQWFSKWPAYLRWEARLKAELRAEEFGASWERGMTLTFQRAVTAYLDEFLRPARILERTHTANQNLLEPLTSREYEILLLIAQGFSNRQIAAHLFIEVSTVKRHINNCYGKLNVRSRTQAILKAQDLNLI